MAAHRYWRVRPTTMWGNAIAAFDCAECEMAETYGGADECAGGTALSRTAFAGLPASAAFDNNLGTPYGTDGPVLGTEYLGYDFGAGVTKDIAEIRLYARAGWLIRHPVAGVVERSDDGATWTQAWTFTGKCVAAGAWLSLPDPAVVPALAPLHRYWGIQANAIQGTSGQIVGNYFRVLELELRDSPGGTNTCTGGAGLSALGDPASAPGQAFDGNFFTRYDSRKDAALTDILAYDFGLGNEIGPPEEIALSAPETTTYSEYNGAPTDFDLIWSDDNENWTVFENYTTSADWVHGETRLFSVASPASARRRGFMSFHP